MTLSNKVRQYKKRHAFNKKKCRFVAQVQDITDVAKRELVKIPSSSAASESQAVD